jgi:hypothetical protein
MPVTLDATVGGATSNAYRDVATATTYFDNRLHVSAWTTASADDKARALIMATRRLDVVDFLGERATASQRLQWPKVYVDEYELVEFTAAELARLFNANSIPEEIGDATCELALMLLNAGSDTAAVDALSKFSQLTVPGTISLTLRDTDLPSNDALPPVVLRLIDKLLRGDVGVTRLVRG